MYYVFFIPDLAINKPQNAPFLALKGTEPECKRAAITFNAFCTFESYYVVKDTEVPNELIHLID